MTIVTVGKLFLQVAAEEQAYVSELCAALQGQIRQVIGRCLDEELKAEVDRLLEREAYVRRKRSKRQKVRLRCSRCLSHERQNFRRNGHYPRKLNAQ
jgi:VIT1/CCC1 family predicted Fe2+/Mn2+ transporter